MVYLAYYVSSLKGLKMTLVLMLLGQVLRLTSWWLQLVDEVDVDVSNKQRQKECQRKSQWLKIMSAPPQPSRKIVKWDYFPYAIYIIHTVRKVKFLSKNSILTKPQHFHEFFTQKNRQFSREIKFEFLDKKWRFRTVCRITFLYNISSLSSVKSHFSFFLEDGSLIHFNF